MFIYKLHIFSSIEIFPGILEKVRKKSRNPDLLKCGQESTFEISRLDKLNENSSLSGPTVLREFLKKF